jgi:D-alanyl-D-alanine endopeptidase (penicillin-binding protein 7)
MRRGRGWLALHDRERARSRRKGSLFRLAGLAVIACGLSLPVTDVLAASKNRPAVAKKARYKASHPRIGASQVRAVKAGKPVRLFKAASVAAAGGVAVDEVRPHIERFRPDPAAYSPPEQVKPVTSGENGKSAAETPAVASRTVLVFDETSGKSIFSRNDEQSQPIASITKLMTAMVVLDAKLPMDERLTITSDDVDHLRGSSSRVPVGAELTREEVLRLALMSSENRAAAALSRNYPGGLRAFVRAMNAKAEALGMSQSQFEDSTGLDGGNRASAVDLVRMVQAAHEYERIREFTTTGSYVAELGHKHVEFRNTNALVRSRDWDIGLSKTGYIREAGRCLVMHARIAARPVVIVLLDGDGKYTRIGDAARIKKWLETKWRGIDLLAGNI